MRPRASFLVRSCAFVLGGAFAALAACSNMSEGDVCNQSLGNSDCQSGLVCRAPNLGSVNPNYPWRCCPPVGTPSSVAACQESTQISTTFDAGGDGAVGSGSDGGNDGGADAGDGAAGDAQPADAADGAAMDAADGAADGAPTDGAPTDAGLDAADAASG